MHSKYQPHHAHPVAEQTVNNATSWIGQEPGASQEIVKGQTFVTEEEGDLETIEVLPNVVTDPGKLIMTLHNFNDSENSWGPALGSAVVELKKPDAGKWIAFHLPALHLQKGKTYGFRLQCEKSLVGVAEAAGSAKHPPLFKGQEWRFTGNSNLGDAFSYFSLAFKVALRA